MGQIHKISLEFIDLFDQILISAYECWTCNPNWWLMKETILKLTIKTLNKQWNYKKKCLTLYFIKP